MCLNTAEQTSNIHEVLYGGACNVTGNVSLYLTSINNQIINAMNDAEKITVKITVFGTSFLVPNARLMSTGSSWENAVGSREVSFSFEGFTSATDTSQLIINRNA